MNSLLNVDEGEGCTTPREAVPGVYWIPRSCRKVHIGETMWRCETKSKECPDACRKGMTEKSALAEHAWKNYHPIRWEETSVVDRARRQEELLLKEALHIQMTPVEDHFNRDGGVELPGCWIATLKKLGGGLAHAGPCPQEQVRNTCSMYV